MSTQVGLMGSLEAQSASVLQEATHQALAQTFPVAHATVELH